jgi:hypothetical protein
MADVVEAHEQTMVHRYMMHFPDHSPRTSDPNYTDFNAFHRKYRQTARCLMGVRYGDFSECRDAQGNPAPAPDDPNQKQAGLELHHSHIEFSLQNAVDLKLLEKDYPGVSDPDSVGAWVESGANLEFLCAYHHRGAGGAHTVTHSDWEASRYVMGLFSPIPKDN